MIKTRAELQCEESLQLSHFDPHKGAFVAAERALKHLKIKKYLLLSCQSKRMLKFPLSCTLSIYSVDEGYSCRK